MPAARSLAIRLSLDETDKLRAALKGVEGDFAEVFRKIDSAADPSARQLDRIENRLDAAARGAKQFGRDTDALAQLLDKGKISLERHNELLDLSRKRYTEGASAAKQFGTETSGIGRAVDTAKSALGTLGIAVSAAFAVDKVKDFVREVGLAGETMARYEAKFKIETGGIQTARDLLRDVYNQAQSAGVKMADAVTLFSRNNEELRKIGATQADVLKFIDTVQKSFVVAGASLSESQSIVTQLSQGLAAGRLNGDELRSILENNRVLAKAIAAEFGVGTGELKKLGEEGRLVSERVLKGILAGATEINAKFAEMPDGIERGQARLENSWTRMGAALDKILGVSRAWAGVLNTAADAAERAARWLEGRAAQAPGQAQSEGQLKRRNELTGEYTRLLETQATVLEKLNAAKEKGEDTGRLESALRGIEVRVEALRNRAAQAGVKLDELLSGGSNQGQGEIRGDAGDDVLELTESVEELGTAATRASQALAGVSRSGALPDLQVQARDLATAAQEAGDALDIIRTSDVGGAGERLATAVGTGLTSATADFRRDLGRAAEDGSKDLERFFERSFDRLGDVFRVALFEGLGQADFGGALKGLAGDAVGGAIQAAVIRPLVGEAGSLLSGILGNGSSLLGSAGGALGLPTIGNALSYLTGSGAFASGFTGPLTAAQSATAAAGTLGSLGSIALPIAGIALPLLLGGLFNQKPSNKGAESSFRLDDGFTNFFEGTKHPDRIAAMDAVAADLQTALARASRAYGVGFDPAAVVGSTVGNKEGSRLFYDPGQGIENRLWVDAGEDAAGMQAAAERVVVEAIKGGFAAAATSPDASQSARDVAIAMLGSKAESFAQLDADRSFAAAVDGLAELGRMADPVAVRMRAAADAGRQLGEGWTAQVRDFQDRMAALGLGTEQAADGTTRADDALRGFVRSILGVDAPVDAVAEATRTAEAAMEAFRPTIEAVAGSAEEAAQMMAAASAKITASARQAAIAVEMQSADSYNRAIYGSGYQPPADSFLYGLVGSRYEIPSGGGAFSGLVNAIEGARGGSKSALDDVYARALANQRSGVFSTDERLAVESFAAELFSRWQTRQAAEPSPESLPGDGSSDAAAVTELARALQSEITSLQLLERGHQDAATAAERLAQTLGQTAGGLRQFREGLLTGSTSPLSPEAQLAEARRQEAAALARVLAAGDDAPEAARELQQAAARVQELARTVFGSSSQSVAIFTRSIEGLTAGETRTRSIESQQLDAAEAANALLGGVREDLARLADELRRIQGGGTPGAGTPGTGGDGGTPGTGGGGTPGTGGDGGGAPPIPAPGGQYAFGFTGLGRGANETAQQFLLRMFPQQAASLMADGSITEREGYDWAQAAHASGLGLTNAAYFSAARDAGYLGVFSQGGHTAFLSPGGTPVLPRWYKFIDELRERAEVPYGHFGIAYAGGGLAPHVPGLTTPGRDSLPAWLTPGERVLTVEQTRWFDSLVARTGNDEGAGGGTVRSLDAWRAERARADAAARQDAARLEARVAQLEAQLSLAVAALNGIRSDLRIVIADGRTVGGTRSR
ncbi:hypothetical protein STVA_41400 [Allostella vacuolata]|nr:hypothetical protein STVA_41400 [Stella vacuolata]